MKFTDQRNDAATFRPAAALANVHGPNATAARRASPLLLATWCTCAVAAAPLPTMPRPAAKGWADKGRMQYFAVYAGANIPTYSEIQGHYAKTQ